MENTHHTHSHGHGHLNKAGDKYSIMSTLINGGLDIITSYYSASSITGLLDGSQDDTSLHARIIGCIGGAAALLSMYTHYRLYKFHQRDKNGIKSDEGLAKEEPSDNMLLPASPSINNHTRSDLTTPLTSASASTDLESGSNEDVKPDHKESSKLTTFQKTILGLDGVTHTLGSGGAIAGVVNSILAPSSFWGKVIMHGTALTIGAISSVAEVRNCADALLDENKEEHPKP